jgi:hypothetical protein
MDEKNGREGYACLHSLNPLPSIHERKEEDGEDRPPCTLPVFRNPNGAGSERRIRFRGNYSFSYPTDTVKKEEKQKLITLVYIFFFH